MKEKLIDRNNDVSKENITEDEDTQSGGLPDVMADAFVDDTSATSTGDLKKPKNPTEENVVSDSEHSEVEQKWENNDESGKETKTAATSKMDKSKKHYKHEKKSAPVESSPTGWK